MKQQKITLNSKTFLFIRKQLAKTQTKKNKFISKSLFLCVRGRFKELLIWWSVRSIFPALMSVIVRDKSLSKDNCVCEKRSVWR